MTELADAKARAASLNVRSSFIMEAPAGSGKTGLLIQRYLKLLAEGDVDEPEEILAITFTRKATAELRERIMKELSDAAEPADASLLQPFKLASRTLAQTVLARSSERNWDILRQPQRLKIRTIDSLSHEIAQHLPLLSGLGGGLAPVDDASLLYKEAARRTLGEIASTDATLAAAVRTLLLHRDGSLRECERMLVEMLARRDEWARALPKGAEWNDAHLEGMLRPRLAAMVRDLFPDAPECSGEEWELLRACLYLLRHAIAHLKIIFAAHGQCDFTEISLAAIDALDQGGGELAAAMGVRFRHLLVDEMQDTSLSQYVLLELLTAGWDGASQTVFLVGDPRQSIYLFRMARVERFLAAVKTGRLGEVPVTHLKLTTNFRSHPGLVDAFNQHFAVIRPHEIGADAESHTDAVAGRAGESAMPPRMRLHWHALVLDSNDGRERETADAVAVIDAAWQRLRTTEHEHPPIAVLVRVKSHAMRIAAALRQAAIPYRATEIESLAGQQEVLDALSLLRAMLHPADRVAWLAVLRAPWCGLSVRDLHVMAGEDDPSLATHCIDELLTQRAARLSSEGRACALHMQAILHAAQTQAGRQAMALWLRSAWHTLGAPLYLDAQQCANVEALFDLITASEERGEIIDANLLLQRLEDLCARDLATQLCAVEIMTIHKAKGLEWDTVIVPGLDLRGRTGSAPLLHVLHEGDTQLMAPVSPKGDDADSLHRHLGERRRDSLRHELRRLFYVAATRAREELHLFAQLIPNAKDELRPHPNSLLHAAWPAAEPYFDVPVTEQTLAIAAQSFPSRTVRRIPASVDVAARYARHASAPLPAGDASGPPQRTYQRAEGSPSARALGSVVHAYLDKLAQEFAAGAAIETSALESWLPGIAAMLRAHGLAPAELKPRADQALAALRSTLADPQGRWLLAPHPQAASEFAISTWMGDGALATYRMDRVFRAGDAPLADGEDFLWIVDYKISAHGDDANDAFFAVESEKHRSQLETYARAQQPALADVKGIRLAAFYPLRKSGEKLKVWKYEP
ncbi:MAG TPA: UvrD-helicase domain-containing protein [Acidobacteriaceae bacterium]|jgi:ATP-dependent helicase/nuclease subunit A|nr:UvrD-helicase domain-containing protein [Acidobacteriaceae bacterium]